MERLQIFKNDEFGEVRTTTIEGKPYFCGSDVAKALGYSRPIEAVNQHCEKDGTVTCRTLTNGGEQDVKFISEGNVHRLIVAASKQSKNKEIQNKAKKYASWIFDEIMPSIHSNGYYSMNGGKDELHISNAPIGEVASFSKVMVKIMEKQCSHPLEIAEAFKSVCGQFGIWLPDSFIKRQHQEQMSLILPSHEKSEC